MPSKQYNCPECGKLVEGNSGVGGYGHLLVCFNVADRGIDGLRQLYGNGSSLHDQRVVESLDMLSPARSGESS